MHKTFKTTRHAKCVVYSLETWAGVMISADRQTHRLNNADSQSSLPLLVSKCTDLIGPASRQKPSVILLPALV